MKNNIHIFLFLFVCFFYSCENNDVLMSDDEIIEAIIESENRVIVSKSDLPKSTISNLDYEMPDEVIRLAELVPELGYEIEMKSWSFFDFELDYERNDNKYFNIDGRKLESSTLKKDEWGNKKDQSIKDKRKKRGPCFKFVYPISYEMSDGSIISGNNRKEIYIQMKEYFKLNGKSKENRPKLILPVQILTLDKNKKVQKKEISNIDDLKSLWKYCKRSKGSD